jgi:hypothetical protein
VPEAGVGPNDCPVIPLGFFDDTWFFLDMKGQVRGLSTRQLHSQAGLIGLFHSQDDWLVGHFPRMGTETIATEGAETRQQRVVGFLANAAGAYLMRLCSEAGMFGPHIGIYPPGVWPSAQDKLVVHCGNAVFADGGWHPAGLRRDSKIYVAGPPLVRPAEEPANAAMTKQLHDQIRALWDFRDAGAETVVLAWCALASYGAAPSWRSHLFFTGADGSGKTSLCEVMRGLLPQAFYTNDTSRPGLEQELCGRGVPVIIDEVGGTTGSAGADNLLTVVLSASAQGGTEAYRGTVSGKSRSFRIACPILMSAITPPTMQPQHSGRFCIIELQKAGSGTDHRAGQQELISEAKRIGPSFLARMLNGYPRWRAYLPLFREALGRQGCNPRQMDQLASMLSAWWVASQDDQPAEHDLLYEIGRIAPLISTPEEIAANASHRHLLQRLLSSRIVVADGMIRRSVAEFLEEASQPSGETSVAYRTLLGHGMRLVRANEPSADTRGRPVPRPIGQRNAGVWFARGHRQISDLFTGTPWEGQAWESVLARCETAAPSHDKVRFGIWCSRAIWVSLDEILDNGSIE